MPLLWFQKSVDLCIYESRKRRDSSTAFDLQHLCLSVQLSWIKETHSTSKCLRIRSDLRQPKPKDKVGDTQKRISILSSE